jgi:hypothetical protein
VALVDLVPFLFLALLAALCWAMLQGYKFTLGPVLHLVADVLNTRIPVIGVRPFGFLASGIQSFDSEIQGWLAAGIRASERGWAAVLHAHAVLWHDLTGALADLAEATQSRLSHLPRAIIQTIIPAWVYPLRTTVHYLQKLLARLEAKVATLPRIVTHAVTHETTKVVTRIERFTVVKVRTVVHAVPGITAPAIPRVPALERTLHGIDATLKDALKRLTRPAIAAAVVAALATLGMSWARCSRVKKAGKSICGMDDSLLESLLAGSLVLFGTISLVELAETFVSITEELSGEVLAGFRETRGLTPLKFTGYTGKLG